MKNYRTRKDGTNRVSNQNRIKGIIESRLQMQSVQRYLADYGIPGRDMNYFQSRDFVENHFNKWTDFRKKNFLVTIVGKAYWKQLKEMIEKE